MKNQLLLAGSSIVLGLYVGGCDSTPTNDPVDAQILLPDGRVIPADTGMNVDAAGGDTGPPRDSGPPSGYVDPACTDGRYTEVLPDPTVSLAGITFTGDVSAFVDEALGRRYPFGLTQVQGGRMDPRFGGNCDVLFAGSPTDAAGVYRRMEVMVHECGHINDGRLGTFGNNHYDIRDSLSFMCQRGDTTSRGGDTFERSRIRTDSYQSMRPPCSGGGRGCDFYANTYLDGNPDDGTFQGGDQGFNMVLEEAVQYVNSIATVRAFADQMRGSTSARDGILTFLWYIERYLRMARLMYPDAYTRISGDACWRDAILTVWGRAWLYLEATRGMSSLGIDDAAIEALVAAPELLDEIERLRTLSSCP